MRIVALACLLFVGAVLAQPTINPLLTVAGSWAGNTSSTGKTFFPPIPGTSPACTITPTVPSFYLSFNYTATIAGTRQVALMTEVAFKPFISVFMYRGAFTPSQTTVDPSSCTNFVAKLGNQGLIADAGVFTINDPRYFEANQLYTFVVTSTAPSTAVLGSFGTFALNVIESSQVGDTASSGFSWNAPNGANPCAPSGDIQQFSLFNFVGGTSGFFDVYALATANSSIYGAQNQQVYFAIFNGFKTAAQLSVDSCTDRRWAGSSGSQIFWTTYQPTLTAGSPYTFVISAKNPGPWGVQFIPTRTVTAFTSTSAVYPQPNRNIGACSANASATAAAYIRVSLTPAANQYVYFVDTYFPAYSSIAGFPQISFAYGGSNAAAPVACIANVPITSVAQTGSQTNLTPGGQSAPSTPLVVPTPTPITDGYTAFISTLDGGQLAAGPTNAVCPWGGCTAWGVQVFTMTGQLVGNLPSGVTSGSTSSTSGGSLTTSGTSGAANSTSTTGGTPAPTATTGGTPTPTPTTGTPAPATGTTTAAAATTGAAAATSTTSSASSLSFFSAAVLLVASFVLASL